MKKMETESVASRVDMTHYQATPRHLCVITSLPKNLTYHSTNTNAYTNTIKIPLWDHTSSKNELANLKRKYILKIHFEKICYEKKNNLREKTCIFGQTCIFGKT